MKNVRKIYCEKCNALIGSISKKGTVTPNYDNVSTNGRQGVCLNCFVHHSVKVIIDDDVLKSALFS